MASDISVRVGIDGAADFKRTLGNINAALKTNAAELKKVNAEFEDGEDAGAALAAEMQVLEKRMELLRQKETAERQELERLTRKYGEASTQVENHNRKMVETETEIIKLNKRLPKMREELARLNDGTGELADSTGDLAEGLGEGAELAGELGTVLSGAAVLGGVREFTQALRECAGASIEFESAITGVYKTVDGTPEQLAAIKSGIKDMAGEIPASTTELASVAEAAGQLGIACDDILSFTRTMVMLGTTTNMSADSAATTLARFANVAGTAPADYERLGSVIVALGNNLATTESEITEMAQRLASAGTLAGLSEANIMALAAAMSSVGIEAEAGGTAMTQTLNGIEKAVDSGGAKLEKIARIAGVSAADFAAKWKGEPMAALSAFVGGLGQLDEQNESNTAVLEELGMSGIRQSNMLRSLALASEQLTGAVELADTAWAENIALQDEANLRYDTTESKLQLLSNSTERLAAACGDVLTPALGTMAEMAAKGENKLAAMLETEPQLASATAALGTGMATFAVGTVATTVLQCEKLVAVLNALRLAALSNPFTAIAAGVMAIGAAAVTSEKGQEILERLAGTAETLIEKYGSLTEVQERLAAAEAEQNRLAELGYDAHTLLTEGYESANKVTAERAKRCIELNGEIQELTRAEAAFMAQQAELGDVAPVNLDGSIIVSTEGLEDVPELAAAAQESLAALGAGLDMSDDTRMSGVNTMQGYIAGLDGEKEKVYAKTQEIAQGVLKAWNGALDIHSPSGEFEQSAEYSADGYLQGWRTGAAKIYDELRQSGAEAIAAFNAGVYSQSAGVAAELRRDMESAWKRAQVNYAGGNIKFSELQKALKNAYSVGVFDEETYYKKLKALRDKYLTADDSEWMSVGLELYNQSQKQMENVEKELDGFVDDYRQAMEDMADMTGDALDDIQDRYDDVAAARDKMADKLAGWGDLYETVKLSYSDGSSGEYLKLGDIEGQIEHLQKYREALGSLQERGISEGLLSEVLGLGVDDALAYSRELLSQSDEAWQEYNRQWEQKQQLARAIADEYYRDELSALEDEYAAALRDGLAGLNEISAEAGGNVVAGLIGGMQEREDELRAEMQKIADTIESELKLSLDMHSPSKRLENLSALAGEGLIVGFEPKIDELRELINTAVPVDLATNYRQVGNYQRDGNMVNALGMMLDGSRGGGDMTVVLKVGGLEFARAVLPDFRRASAESPVAEVDF